MKINEAVHAMRPPRYTISQAADLVGKDADTLRRWMRKGIYVPHERVTFGTLNVVVYTKADITAMKKIARELKPGRKPGASTAA